MAASSTPGSRTTASSASPPRGDRFALWAGLLWVLAGAVYLSGEAIAASAFPGYRYATNYISDLGVAEVGSFQGRELDSPLHVVMNVAFVLQGILFVLAAASAIRLRSTAGRRRAAVVVFVSLAVVHGAGITLVGLVSGGPVNAANGLGAVHVLGAGMAIIGGNLAAITAGLGTRRDLAPAAYRVASVLLGLVGLGSLLMLIVDSGSNAFELLPDGVWERMAVYTITAWELLTGALLLVSVRRR